MKKIMIMSYGNPMSAKTWSNMPFYLIKSLNKIGIETIPIDLYPYRSLLSKLFGFRRRILNKITNKDLYISYDRSKIFNYFIKRKMKKAVKNNEFDLCISLTYSFNPKEFTEKTCIMLCDWTTEYAIKHISQRFPTKYENKTLEIQKVYLQSSDLNITIFKEVSDYYSNNKDIKIEYLGNVINLPAYSTKYINILDKFNSKNIIFIGKKQYISALNCLIKALEILDEDIHLNIIGIDEFPTSYENVTFYGYLDKSNTEELEKYLNIINSSKCIINTNTVFAGFTALGEAMSMGTPVITSKTSVFLNLFGEKENFGLYSANNPDELAYKIKKIMTLDYENYKKLSLNCNELTQRFSWDAYTLSILNRLEELNKW